MLIPVNVKVYTNEMAAREAATADYRTILKRSLVSSEIAHEVAPVAFVVRNTTPMFEMAIPDFYLPEHKTYLIITNGISLSARDQQRVAMLKGMYPDFEFVALTRKDVNHIQGRQKTIEEFILKFNTEIE